MSVLGLTTNSPSFLADGPEKKALEGLRVMQWNVLADGLAQFGDFCRVIIASQRKESMNYDTVECSSGL